MAVERTLRLSFFTVDGGPYQELLREECLQTAHHHGIEVRLFVADSDARKQVSQIEACLRDPPSERPNVIMVAPVREIALLASVNAAARAGIGVVFLLRSCEYMDQLRDHYPDLPIFCVLADQLEIGRIQGRQLKALLPQGGEVVYIRGPLGTSSGTGRSAGLQEVLGDSPISLFPINSDWTLEGGTRAVTEWTDIFRGRELPPFHVAAQNDSMAMGARNALESMAQNLPSASTGSIAFCGSDGVPTYGQRLVKQGVLTSTIIMPPSSGKAVTEIASMLRGGPRPPSPIVLTPSAFPDPDALTALPPPKKRERPTRHPPRRG
jgi:ribose transport system substrate-binding protein